MNSYQKINNITGWLVFAVAFWTYGTTVEPTASFWDCGEFIAVSYKLQVPHPPGAPLFLLLGRVFSFLSFGNVQQVAFWINMLSVLSSVFASLFLFWTITMLAKKVVCTSKEPLDNAKTIIIMGAGVVGALAGTYCDSVWFSAVEGEVYGMSLFFTSITVWAILKWELIADEKHADRWIVLIAYLVGLSTGVHLLNLLTIPALALIYYYKKYPVPSKKGTFITLLISVLILGFIQYGVIQESASIGGGLDLFFVNNLGLPFGSGILFLIVLVVGSMIYGFRWAKQKGFVALHTSLLCLMFIMIGYSSYTLIIIKSTFNPPINENSPDNVMSFLSYLKREQYGDRPLLHGQQFTAKLIDQQRGEERFKKGKQKYEVYDYKIINIFDPKHETLFPRMYSNQPDHKEIYEEESGAKGGRKPTFIQNMKFFFVYQLNHMYWRYFLWNFSGRESDIQDCGWLSPLETNKGVPEQIRNNRARNNFYMIPLVLGILGLYFHSKADPRNSFFVFLLFIMTGIAIIVYLNQYPLQPRERDYAYAASFFTFSIWIGFGVIALYNYLSKFIKSASLLSAFCILLGLVAPAIMAKEGWDDHDRSNRYTAVDSAKNLLNSCEKNAVMFTNGDNDTFPLWYAQEVEGFRTDVRVCNLSLINTDWYISQMKRKTYESEALPVTLGEDDYQQGTNEYIPFVENKKVTSLPLDIFIKLIKAKSRSISVPLQSGEMINSYPTKTFELSVDKEKVISNGTVSPKFASLVPDKMSWKINKSSLSKQDLFILDLLSTNNWQRPIYFAITVGPSNFLGLEEFFELEGFAYRVTPVKIPGAKNGRVNTEKMYNTLMNKFFWRNMDNPKVYYDENHTRFALNARNNYTRLANELIREGQTDKAKELIKYCMKILPDTTFNFDVFTTGIVGTLFRLKEDTLAKNVALKMVNRANENLEYFLKFERNKMTRYLREQIGLNWHILREIYEELDKSGYKSEAEKIEPMVRKHYEKLMQLQ
ncbi:MAG: glycosyltransferase [Bacteroidetes bacterium RIFCSPLOWO2_02_FULL_36_8]|nr:MAG: glycosyltransferase [Bacteroidetes bacterium RIFCSPLOWO2_02_FULL_36_8]